MKTPCSSVVLLMPHGGPGLPWARATEPGHFMGPFPWSALTSSHNYSWNTSELTRPRAEMWLQSQSPAPGACSSTVTWIPGRGPSLNWRLWAFYTSLVLPQGESCCPASPCRAAAGPCATNACAGPPSSLLSFEEGTLGHSMGSALTWQIHPRTSHDSRSSSWIFGLHKSKVSEPPDSVLKGRGVCRDTWV